MPSTAKIFAHRLQETRALRRMSQARVAEGLSKALGTSIHATAIAKIEAGERSVKIEEAVAIAEILAVPLASLTREPESDDVRLETLQRAFCAQRSRQNSAWEEVLQAEQVITQILGQLDEIQNGKRDV